jgi:hypothetical protein
MYIFRRPREVVHQVRVPADVLGTVTLRNRLTSSVARPAKGVGLIRYNGAMPVPDSDPRSAAP